MALREDHTGRSALALVLWLGLCFSAAGIGGFFAPGSWYASSHVRQRPELDALETQSLT